MPTTNPHSVAYDMLVSHDGALSWQAFWLPKRGHKLEEYEDAFAGDSKVGRFAVADGASESSFSALWAKLLVGGFVNQVSKDAAERNWLLTQQQRWAATVDQLTLPWYNDEKRRIGASATFLGLIIKQSDRKSGGRWKAVAIGDSCLFQVRKDHLIGAFPLEHSSAFGNQPLLVNSRPVKGTGARRRDQLEWGKWQPGDLFFLMTDALAQWFLLRHEEQRKPWHSLVKRLGDPKPDAVLGTYIEQLRDDKAVRNDDVTLVSILPECG